MATATAVRCATNVMELHKESHIQKKESIAAIWIIANTRMPRSFLVAALLPVPAEGAVEPFPPEGEVGVAPLGPEPANVDPEGKMVLVGAVELSGPTRK